jgi:Zn-dependent M28 family amino/carboxypeptidase
VRLLALAPILAVLALIAPPAQASAPGSARILTDTQQSAVERHLLRVRVVARRALVARVAATGAKPVRVRFRRAGRETVVLRLKADGVRRIQGCGEQRVVVRVRLKAGRRSARLRTARTLAAEVARCLKPSPPSTDGGPPPPGKPPFTSTPATSASSVDLVKALPAAITIPRLLVHERALQRIADQNGGIRASGTPGYQASLEYVVGALRDAGYQPRLQSFAFPYFKRTAPEVVERVSPSPKTFTPDTDTTTLTYSPSGDVSGKLRVAANLGCAPSDFSAFVPGELALIQRGTCAASVKARNAQQAGVVAALISNNVASGPAPLAFDGPGVVGIPSVGLTQAAGQELAADVGAGDTVVHVKTTTVSETRSSQNVIADTPGGDPNRTVLLSAHLDSVETGPGINDNGSGTATILEFARQMAAIGTTPRNRVRFLFTGGEELGLLGSQAYANALTPAEARSIQLDLNFDMLASPNYVFFTYGGREPDLPVAPGSTTVEQHFVDYLNARGYNTDQFTASGRADLNSFQRVGIPAAGLFSGANMPKTARQASLFGGAIGVDDDACYHLACDTIDNLNYAGWTVLADAAAEATAFWATTSTPLERPATAARRSTAQPRFRGPLALR